MYSRSFKHIDSTSCKVCKVAWFQLAILLKLRKLRNLTQNYRKSQKKESNLLHTYVLNEFLTANHSCTTKYFWKTTIELYSSHLYASFGTFCVKIGRIFETQRYSKFREEIEIDLIFFKNSDFTVFKHF